MPACDIPAPRRGPRSQVIVMGMSRSGTSLTTSIIAALLRADPNSERRGAEQRGSDGDGAWRGGGPAYPMDTRNPHGYFERKDAVLLNYKYVQEVSGASWTRFPANYASHPTLLNFSSPKSAPKRALFEFSARAILSDMEKHAPWVLKDVRFARTLPLWWPLLREPLCIIPYRHPLEVADSSIIHSVALWENYLTAAIASTRAMRCPTMLVSYSQWLEPAAAAAQFDRLQDFFRCGQVLINLLVDSPRLPTLWSLNAF